MITTMLRNQFVIRPVKLSTITGQFAGLKHTLRFHNLVAEYLPEEKEKMMARAIEDGLERGGVEVIVLPLKSSNRSVVATELLEAGALLVGSPTINNNIFPSVADVLTYMRGLKPANLVGAAFGSFGWSGEGARQVNDFLAGMKVDVVAEALNLQFRPDAEGIEKCRELGAAVAARLKEVIENGA